MSERIVQLSPIEIMLVRLAADRRGKDVRVADLEFESALAPVMLAHGKQPAERAEIRDGPEPDSFVLAFTVPDIGP